MSTAREAFAGQAEALVGTPFRLHGRSETGLDCVGLVALALHRAGIVGTAPLGYALRNSDIERHLACAGRSGFHPAPSPAPIERGDLLLTAPGASQHHLLVALGGMRFVHAHAGLRRVALHCGLITCPVQQHWRLALS